MVIYKEKICLDCKKTFTPTSGVQLRCGNYKIKTGCSYQSRLKDDRDLHAIIRKGEQKPFKVKLCNNCGKKFSCCNRLINNCTNCKNYAKKDRQNKWHKQNRDRVNEGLKKQYKKRKEDSNFILKRRVMRKLRKLLLNNSDKQIEELKYLGCQISHWRTHLESKFTQEMNWNNYGIYWDIDHIKPFSCFDLNKESERYIVFNYKNTQPLNSHINRYVKRSKTDWVQVDDI